MIKQHFKNQELARAYMMGVIDTQKKILGLDKDPKPKTNFDKVTASPETLAEYISYSFRCLKSGLCREGESCTTCIAKWLKQEVENEE